ncbi:hypothetical protein Mapa_000767 [Marchantia paleacea]|nr:hypothetical protein Mapa_000767 [Marchantia paleacea]
MAGSLITSSFIASRTLWRISSWSASPSYEVSYYSSYGIIRKWSSPLTCSTSISRREDWIHPEFRVPTANQARSKNSSRLSSSKRPASSTRLMVNAGVATSSSVIEKSDYAPSLKSRLLAGEKLYGAFSLSFSNVVAEILGWAGYDFVVVDMEHGPGDTFAALPVLQALAATNTSAVIRLPVNDPALVKKALDLGPAGIMFPMIENAEEARRAVAACRYPPFGIRGAAHPLVRASRYGLNACYLDSCEQDLLVMCQVETEAAVNRIPEIAGVEGVDCIQMGPLDLKASIGLLRQPGEPGGLDLLKRAETAVFSCERKVLLAGFTNPESSSEQLFERGYDIVSGAVDVALLRDAAVADLKKNKPIKRG